MEIIQGPITDSDHTPMIIKLTARAITKPINETMDIQNADWDTFQYKIKSEMTQIQTPTNMTTNEIEEYFKTWQHIIVNTTKKIIPTKKTKIAQKQITSPFLRYIQHRFQSLINKTKTEGWDRGKYCEYRLLQVAVRNEATKISNNNWTQTLHNITLNYRDPQKLWSQIKIMKGKQQNINHYLIKENNKIVKKMKT